MSPEMIAALGAVVGSAAAIASVVVAFWQLDNLRKTIQQTAQSQRIDALKVVLEIETQMNERKMHFDRVSREIREKDAAGAPAGEMAILGDFFETAKESYFNALDRLCFCMEKKYLDERDWRAEYRNLVRQTIAAYEGDFGAASPYRHIISINTLWQSE